MRATAIIIKDDSILLMHRFHNGEDYFAVPGGGVEEGESAEDAVIREVKEETNFDAKINRKLWEYYYDYDKRMHHAYLITDFSGDLQLGGPEMLKNSLENSYILEWHKLSNIKNLKIYPEILKDKILAKFVK